MQKTGYTTLTSFECILFVTTSLAFWFINNKRNLSTYIRTCEAKNVLRHTETTAFKLHLEI
jgi:hypothetical protein